MLEDEGWDSQLTLRWSATVIVYDITFYNGELTLGDVDNVAVTSADFDVEVRERVKGMAPDPEEQEALIEALEELILGGHAVTTDDLAIFDNQATREPTNAPTWAPTTHFPSLSPTYNPTESPTHSPTNSPSESPTISPTPNPTISPTPSPTKAPTTSFPTRNPTVSPTTSPTFGPTTSPTREPTPELTPGTLVPVPSVTDANGVATFDYSKVKFPSELATKDTADVQIDLIVWALKPEDFTGTKSVLEHYKRSVADALPLPVGMEPVMPERVMVLSVRNHFKAKTQAGRRLLNEADSWEQGVVVVTKILVPGKEEMYLNAEAVYDTLLGTRTTTDLNEAGEEVEVQIESTFLDDVTRLLKIYIEHDPTLDEDTQLRSQGLTTEVSKDANGDDALSVAYPAGEEAFVEGLVPGLNPEESHAVIAAGGLLLLSGLCLCLFWGGAKNDSFALDGPIDSTMQRKSSADYHAGVELTQSGLAARTVQQADSGNWPSSNRGQPSNTSGGFDSDDDSSRASGANRSSKVQYEQFQGRMLADVWTFGAGGRAGRGVGRDNTVDVLERMLADQEDYQGMSKAKKAAYQVAIQRQASMVGHQEENRKMRESRPVGRQTSAAMTAVQTRKTYDESVKFNVPPVDLASNMVMESDASEESSERPRRGGRHRREDSEIRIIGRYDDPNLRRLGTLSGKEQMAAHHAHINQAMASENRRHSVRQAYIDKKVLIDFSTIDGILEEDSSSTGNVVFSSTGNF